MLEEELLEDHRRSAASIGALGEVLEYDVRPVSCNRLLGAFQYAPLEALDIDLEQVQPLEAHRRHQAVEAARLDPKCAMAWWGVALAAALIVATALVAVRERLGLGRDVVELHLMERERREEPSGGVGDLLAFFFVGSLHGSGWR